MSKFKVGDMVVLKKDERNNHYRMYGRVFRVTEVVESDLRIAIDGGDPVWYEGRFEAAVKKVEQPLKANNDSPMIDAKALISFLEFNDWNKSDLLIYLNGYIDGAEGGSK